VFYGQRCVLPVPSVSQHIHGGVRGVFLEVWFAQRHIITAGTHRCVLALACTAVLARSRISHHIHWVSYSCAFPWFHGNIQGVRRVFPAMWSLNHNLHSTICMGTGMSGYSHSFPGLHSIFTRFPNIMFLGACLLIKSVPALSQGFFSDAPGFTAYFQYHGACNI
jgi:hypothetical protein